MTNTNASEKAQVKPSGQPTVIAADAAFNAIDQQEIRQLVDIVGIYCRGAVEPWKYDGKTGESGFIQLLVKARDDSKALDLKRIKVPEECYGLIDLLNKSKGFQPVQLRCEIRTIGKQATTLLVADQPNLKLAPAA